MAKPHQFSDPYTFGPGYWHTIHSTSEGPKVGKVRDYAPIEPRKLEAKDIAPIKHQKADWSPSTSQVMSI